MAQTWNDINDPGVYRSPVEKTGKTKPVDYQTDKPEKNEKQEPEVKLVSATWEPDGDGLEFNKKCTLNIKAEFLKETFRKKITCSLFVLYNGNEEDVKHKVDAYLDTDGNAKADMTLYYGNEYYDAAQENPEATCQYKAKIEHPTATAVLESDLLDMPVCMAVDFVEIADIHFHHNCALPCLDEKGDLISLLASAFSYAKDNAGRELIIEGHADTSGDSDYNLAISKRRAEAIKGLLENDMDLWNGVVACNDHKLETEDYQQTLKGLSERYGWDCDPGDVDNKDGPKTTEGVKGFQTEYNSQYKGTLTVDGVVGPKTWEAIGITIRLLLEDYLKNDLQLDPIPAIPYGYPDGNGIYPCGESCPIENAGDSDYKSEENRRVELVFYKKDDPTPAIAPAASREIGLEKDPVSEKKWKKEKIEGGGGDGKKGEVLQIKILKLDKWFIPGPKDKGGEDCAVQYSLGQADNFSGKVVLEVFASNYCKAEMADDYSFTFSDIGDPIPIFSKEMAQENTEPDKDYSVDDWNGKCTAADGALKPRTGEDRYINAAFSPYTVHFRCFNDQGDGQARVDLLDFWPAWDPASQSVVNDSQTIKWKIIKTDKLKKGKIIVVDKTDQEVFSKDLAESDLSEGDHNFSWDGALSAGGLIQKENMPYRVQIQAWSTDDKTAGISVAAMQTEVRIFVHPDTGKHQDKPWEDPNSLQLGLPPYVVNEPAESEGERWYQWKLASAGFHPGPVNGQWGDASKRALTEFQRSYPKNNTAPYERLTADGAMNNDSKEALKRLSVGNRSLFGDPENNKADLAAEAAEQRLSDGGKNMIVWVDDRQYYTSRFSAPKSIPANDPVYLNDYRGMYSAGDNKVTFDKNTICRPWIPVYAAVGLLSKNDALDAAKGTFNEAVKNAIGPLCVEWSFDEIGEDLSVINTSDVNYNKAVIRSNKWVETIIDSAKASQDGKTYTNCPEKFNGDDCGGIRPQDLSLYYKAPFGLDSESLEPWKAKDDTTNKCVYALAHDYVGQKDGLYSAASTGKAGIYLHPSIIGGDGYRIYSKLSFRHDSGGDGFKNNKILQKRYDSLPMASTAQLRIWRRTSYRNYVIWSPAANNHWNAHRTRNIELYNPAFRHIVYEGGTPNDWALNTLITQAEYAAVVSPNITVAPYNAYTPHLDSEYTWPYMDRPHLGFPRGNLNESINDYFSRVITPSGGQIWMKISEEMIHFLVKSVETKHGLLKGHLLAEFTSSPQISFAQYRCDKCHATMVEVTNNCAPADVLENSVCAVVGCGGHLHVAATATSGGLGFSALGYGLGAAWVFVGNDAALWTHEMGHNKYLEHSQSQPKQPDSPGGFNNLQHDTEVNPSPALAAEPAKDKCWDRACIMSYNRDDPRYFCGKCILKLRGWAIDHITNPAGAVKDA